MPDPNVKPPCHVEQRGGGWRVVDSAGKVVPGSDSHPDQESAQAQCDQINAAWKGAGSERKSKGAPQVTREALDAAVAARAEAAAAGDAKGFARARAREVRLRGNLTGTREGGRLC